MHRKFFITLILLLFMLTFAAAQQPGEVGFRDDPVVPEGIKGKRIRSIIEAVNSEDPALIRRFIEENCTDRFRNAFPMEEHLSTFLNVRQQTGGVEFFGIRIYSPPRPLETVVILKDRNFDSWHGFRLHFDESEDMRIAGIRFSGARTPPGLSQPVLSQADFLNSVEELVTRLCGSNLFSGAVLVAQEDKVLWQHACGEASKRFHVPNNIETRFNLGSMNKMFTATAVARLVEQGRLSFQEPIVKYVDESWLPKEITSKITIHHLLTHTSGLGSYFNDTYMKGSRELYRSVSDFKPLVRGDKPAYEPGERFQYSNTGMLLLGVVIESATGKPYFDAIRELIYEPAGMKRSDSYDMDLPVENLAIGYSPDSESPYGWRNNLYQHVIKGGPAGGGFSTVGDLHRFARAMITGKLVSPDMLRTMWTDYSGEYYGYGFGVESGPNGKIVGHSGGFSGINSTLDIYVDRGTIVAVMSNISQGANPLAQKIKKLLEQTKM